MDATMLDMSKHKPKPGDRHQQPKMTLRLPEPVGDLLREMAAKEDRTITAIVLRALRAYATENGYTWPGSGGGSE